MDYVQEYVYTQISLICDILHHKWQCNTKQGRHTNSHSTVTVLFTNKFTTFTHTEILIHSFLNKMKKKKDDNDNPDRGNEMKVVYLGLFLGIALNADQQHLIDEFFFKKQQKYTKEQCAKNS